MVGFIAPSLTPPNKSRLKRSQRRLDRTAAAHLFVLGCAGCGSQRGLVLHHIRGLRLCGGNPCNSVDLIVLCDHRRGGARCHVDLGHLGHWGRLNPHVRRDAAAQLVTLSQVI